MEKIKQALERARQQQKDSGAKESSGKVDKTSIASDGNERDINYSQTRILTLDTAHLERNRVLCEHSDEEVDTVYRILRTQILQKLVAKNLNSVAITSPLAGQGKTLTAINLALSLAREVNYTVLLVDFDLKNPSIHRYLGVEPKAGISDFIMHDTPLNQILLNPGIEHLVVLPGKEKIHNSSEMLKSDKMVDLVNELNSRYPSRIIIYDVPPLLSTDDALAFSPYVESMLLVVEEGVTTKEELMDCKKLLSSTEFLGTVLNKSAEKIAAGY